MNGILRKLDDHAERMDKFGERMDTFLIEMVEERKQRQKEIVEEKKERRLEMEEFRKQWQAGIEEDRRLRTAEMTLINKRLERLENMTQH